MLFLCPLVMFSRCHLRKTTETTLILHLSPHQISQNARFILPTNMAPSLPYIFFYLLLCSLYLFSLSSRVIFPRFREPNLAFCLHFIVWLTPLSIFKGRVTTVNPGYIPHLFTLWPLLSPLKGSHSIVHFDWAFNLSFVLSLALRLSHS